MVASDTPVPPAAPAPSGFVRELITLGTSSQVPTRFRNHNGYLLRFPDGDWLIDPGEGTQRQLARAELPATGIRMILVTHFHGDHSLGLSGMMQRICYEGGVGPVRVLFPASGQAFYERMLSANVFDLTVEFEAIPIERQGLVYEDDHYRVWARRLSHSVETFGYRIEELRLGGQTVAHIMDTRRCRNAVQLARDVDLLVTECTYLSSEEREAKDRGHLTARHAAQIAQDAGAKRLILTHFSQRYTRNRPFVEEAKPIFDRVRAARDLSRFPFGPGAADPSDSKARRPAEGATDPRLDAERDGHQPPVVPAPSGDL